MTEVDDGPTGDLGDGGRSAPGTALPLGLAGGSVGIDMPLAPPGGNRPAAARQGAPEAEFEIVETDDNYRPLAGQPAPSEPNAAAGAPEQLVGNPPAEQGAPRSREPERRARRREARDANFQRTQQLEQEVRFLHERLAGIEPRLSELDLSRVQAQAAELDRRVQEGGNAVRTANAAIAEAMANGNHEGVVAALERRDRAMLDAHNATVQRQQIEQAIANVRDRAAQPPPEEMSRQPQVAPLPPRALSNIQDFRERYPWFQPERRNPDGTPANVADSFVLNLDRQVAAEGFDPATPEYWDELEDRMSQWLPPRLVGGANGTPASQQAPEAPRPAARQAAQTTPPARRGPMVPGAPDHAPRQGANVVHLSPGRREAMVLAGALQSDGRTVQDEAKFKAYMRQYADFDRANNLTAGR